MKFNELKNKSVNELHKILADFRNNLREMNFKTSSNQLKNIREIREAKKTISRILLLLSAKAKAGGQAEDVKTSLDKPNESGDNKK